ncbi:hypothetical protein [Modestobacter caceresii]|uniref:hypothetical protein n=1 Tax=Modestobacter caceresii TaxID=1522368 RepID=UPI0012DFED85|nr:hypothetical protein [Modestobacter caceresii]
MVRRVKLSVTGEQVFEYVKFAYRRGPDAATSQDIALADLTRANGTPLSAPWTKISDLGDYASWDVSSTLGHVPGPVQVQAIVSADADGAGAYKSAWVTVTVSPDADDAATTEIGPGSANLLTGDYTLSSTDVDEFGLALGRAASSRDPRSGFEPQQELLSAAQETIASVSGLSSNGVTHARVTGRGHGGSEPTKSVLDSLRLVTDGSTADSFVEIAPANGQLRPGATYRADAWIYVPGSTGLAPVSPRGLRVVGFYLDANNVYREVRSNAPVKTDTWQQLSVDMEVPADAKGAPFFRLYSGFGTSGVEVFYDDVSVREIWAPLGPQWSLGTADAAADTGYTRISQPQPDVATLHLSGGGEVWFTASGDGRWWPEPGAESLTLTSVDASTWRVTELDGTVSEFVRQAAATDWSLATTSPPASAGQTRLLYGNVNGRLRLTRLIAPIEPGVDG